jgi:hypothetical protein
MPRPVGQPLALALLLVFALPAGLRAETLVTTDPTAIANFKSGGSVIGFDALPGLTPTGDPGQIVPEASQVLDQFLASHSVYLSSTAGPLAVVKAAACCPRGPSSGENMVAGTTLSGIDFVLDFTAGVVAVFEEPVNGDPAPTDRVGAWNVSQGSTVTLFAYDELGGFEFVSAGPGNFLGIRRPNIVFAQFLLTAPGTVAGFALDDFTFGPRSAVGVGGRPPGAALRLAPPRPNPGRGGELTLSLELPEPGSARLTVLGVDGRVVARRDLGTLGAGPHQVAWATGVRAPGLYFVRLETGAGRSAVQRWIVTR